MASPIASPLAALVAWAPSALLLSLGQFLSFAGNAMGRTAYYLVEDDRHHTNLFAVLVGESSKARKGTSLGRVRAIMKVADQGWSDDRLKGGLSSRGAHQCGPRRAARVEQERGPRGNHRSRHRQQTVDDRRGRVRQRAGGNGARNQQSTCRTQSRISVSQALERIRQAFAVNGKITGGLA